MKELIKVNDNSLISEAHTIDPLFLFKILIILPSVGLLYLGLIADGCIKYVDPVTAEPVLITALVPISERYVLISGPFVLPIRRHLQRVQILIQLLPSPIPQRSQLSEIPSHHLLIRQLYLRLLLLDSCSRPPLLLSGTRLIPLDLPIA
jgi:hypothetical protein